MKQSDSHFHIWHNKSGRLLPPAFWLLMFLLMGVLHFAIPVVQLLDYPATLGGIVLLLTGFILSVKGSALFRAVQTTVITFDQPQQLVTDGLYAYSRNPMYLGLFLMQLGMAILLGSLTALLTASMFFVVMNLHYIAFEEKMLTETFGSKYTAYQQTVRRWL